MIPLGNSGYVLHPAVFLLAEFLLIAGLGYLLLQLIQWDYALRDNRARWLSQLRQGADTLKSVRLGLQKTDWEIPDFVLNAAGRRKWLTIRWIAKVLLHARQVRS